MSCWSGGGAGGIDRLASGVLVQPGGEVARAAEIEQGFCQSFQPLERQDLNTRSGGGVQRTAAAVQQAQDDRGFAEGFAFGFAFSFAPGFAFSLPLAQISLMGLSLNLDSRIAGMSCSASAAPAGSAPG